MGSTKEPEEEQDMGNAGFSDTLERWMVGEADDQEFHDAAQSWLRLRGRRIRRSSQSGRFVREAVVQYPTATQTL